MKTKEKNTYAHLLSLPAQKELLDYIKNKICKGSSPEKYKFVDELFELHRTSNGFVPSNLIKTRFLRLKSAELKTRLFETDTQVGSIFVSEEYKRVKAKFESGNILFEKLQQIKLKLETSDYQNIDMLIEDFKTQIQKTDNYQTVLSFYRFLHPHFGNKQISPEVKITHFKEK